VVVGSHGGGHPHRHPAVAALLAVAVPLLVVALAAVAMTWLLRRPSYQRILQFGWSERRATFKAVRSGRPLTEQETRVARAQLEFQRTFRWYYWMQPIVVVVLVFDGLTHRNAIGWALIGSAGFYAAAFPYLIWQWRRNTERYREALSR
jgi:hypothetical protein